MAHNTQFYNQQTMTSVTIKASTTISLDKIGEDDHIFSKEKTQIPEYHTAISVSG